MRSARPTEAIHSLVTCASARQASVEFTASTVSRLSFYFFGILNLYLTYILLIIFFCTKKLARFQNIFLFWTELLFEVVDIVTKALVV